MKFSLRTIHCEVEILLPGMFDSNGFFLMFFGLQRIYGFSFALIPFSFFAKGISIGFTRYFLPTIDEILLCK